MVSLADMQRFYATNRRLVKRYEIAIFDHDVYAYVLDEVQATPSLIFDKLTTYAVRVAMGYGSDSARERIIPKFVANRLEQ